jgi:predicted DNA repair protein MutK
MTWPVHGCQGGTKAAGVIIDDAAVTRNTPDGLDPKRELPIIWKIARVGFNKLGSCCGGDAA